jgi:NitT/TauT family transport system substrate-binding protein
MGEQARRSGRDRSSGGPSPASGGPLSRKRFLQLGASVGLSAAGVTLLQACSPAQQAAPAAAPAQPPAGSTSAPAAKPAGSPARSLLKVRMVGTQGALGDWAPYVGIENKLFEEEGVELEYNTLGSQPAVTNALISGQSDVAISSITTVISAALQGAPMKLCMATQMATPQGKYNNWWCAAPGAGIEKPADALGKKVHIFAPNSLAQVVTRTVLRKHGVLPEQYEELSFTFDQAYTAIKTGRADVGLFIEPFYTNSNKLARGEYAGREIPVIYTMLDAFPSGMHLAGMLGNTNFMAQNGEAMRRLLRAQSRAARWGLDHPEETKQIIAKYAQVPYENIQDMILAEHSVDGKWLPGFLRQLQEYMITEKTVANLTEPLPDERISETAYLPNT